MNDYPLILTYIFPKMIKSTLGIALKNGLVWCTKLLIEKAGQKILAKNASEKSFRQYLAFFFILALATIQLLEER